MLCLVTTEVSKPDILPGALIVGMSVSHSQKGVASVCAVPLLLLEILIGRIASRSKALW